MLVCGGGKGYFRSSGSPSIDGARLVVEAFSIKVVYKLSKISLGECGFVLLSLVESR